MPDLDQTAAAAVLMVPVIILFVLSITVLFLRRKSRLQMLDEDPGHDEWKFGTPNDPISPDAVEIDLRDLKDDQS